MGKAEVEEVELGQIILDTRNANRHTERGAYQLGESMARHGFAEAGTLDKHNRVIGGNHRAVTAADLGMETALIIDVDGTKPVFLRRKDLDLEEPETRALAYALNRVAEVSIDLDPAQVLADIEDGVDLSPYYFDEEIERMRAEYGGNEGQGGDGADQEDKPKLMVEEAKAKWGVKPGDVWRLGPHFVACGDCTDLTTWNRLTAVAQVIEVDGAFTSPPYAMQRKDKYGGIVADEYVEWFKSVQDPIKSRLAQDGSFFVNIKPHTDNGERALYVFDLVLAMKRAWGWAYIEEYIWRHSGTPGKPKRRLKNQFEPVYRFAHSHNFTFIPTAVQHESDLAFSKHGGGAMGRTQGESNPLADVEKSRGGAYPGNVLDFPKNDKMRGHPAAYHADMPAFFMKLTSRPGAVWFDPFMGSGSTLIAANQCGRVALGTDRDPDYVALTLERWVEEEMGERPERVLGGEEDD